MRGFFGSWGRVSDIGGDGAVCSGYVRTEATPLEPRTLLKYLTKKNPEEGK